MAFTRQSRLDEAEPIFPNLGTNSSAANEFSRTLINHRKLGRI